MPLSARSCLLVAGIALGVVIAYEQLAAGRLRKAPAPSPVSNIFGKAAS